MQVCFELEKLVWQIPTFFMILGSGFWFSYWLWEGILTADFVWRCLVATGNKRNWSVIKTTPRLWWDFMNERPPAVNFYKHGVSVPFKRPKKVKKTD